MFSKLFRKKKTTKIVLPWNSDSQNKLDIMIGKTPQLFRKSARKLVVETAQIKCLDRMGKIVNNDDLIQGFLHNTPDLFKAPMIKNALKIR